MAKKCPTSIFPDAIDGYAQLPMAISGMAIDECYDNSQRSAIINIELTLGAGVQGEYTNVKERLDALEECCDDEGGGNGGGGGTDEIECCDLQGTTDAGNVTTNGVIIGRVCSTAILSNVKVMRENLSLLNEYNGIVVGPFGIDDGVALTVPVGSTFVVV